MITPIFRILSHFVHNIEWINNDVVVFLLILILLAAITLVNRYCRRREKKLPVKFSFFLSSYQLLLLPSKEKIFSDWIAMHCKSITEPMFYSWMHNNFLHSETRRSFIQRIALYLHLVWTSDRRTLLGTNLFKHRKQCTSDEHQHECLSIEQLS